MLGLWRVSLWRDVCIGQQLSFQQKLELNKNLLTPWVARAFAAAIITFIFGLIAARLIDVNSIPFALCWNCFIATAIACHLTIWWKSQYHWFRYYQHKSCYLPISDDDVHWRSIVDGLKGYVPVFLTLSCSLFAVCWLLGYSTTTTLWLTAVLWFLEVLILFVTSVAMANVSVWVQSRIAVQVQHRLVSSPWVQRSTELLVLLVVLGPLASLFLKGQELNQVASQLVTVTWLSPTSWPILLVIQWPEHYTSIGLSFVTACIVIMYYCQRIISRQVTHRQTMSESYEAYSDSLAESLDVDARDASRHQDELSYYRYLHHQSADRTDQDATKLLKLGFSVNQIALLQTLYSQKLSALFSWRLEALIGLVLAVIAWFGSPQVTLGIGLACLARLGVLITTGLNQKKLSYLPIAADQILLVDVKRRLIQSVKLLIIFLPAILIMVTSRKFDSFSAIDYGLRSSLVFLTGVCVFSITSLLLHFDMSMSSFGNAIEFLKFAVSFLATVILGYMGMMVGSAYAWLSIIAMTLTLAWNWKVICDCFNAGIDLRNERKF